MNQQPPLPFVILGFISIVTFIVFGYCFASLRSEIDGEKLRLEPDIAKVFAGGIPPERLLTKKGRLKMKICKVAIVTWAIEAAILVACSYSWRL